MAGRAPESARNVVVCSCEETMQLDSGALARGCGGAHLTRANQLCRAELARFRHLAAADAPLTVGCTQEASHFSQVAREMDAPAALSFVNVRETAGWSLEGSAAGAKMAALIAAAHEPAPAPATVGFESKGVILLYGRDERVLEAGRLLQDHLDVTALVLPGAELAPPGGSPGFPVLQGRIRSAEGYLGAFDLIVDDCAAALPSSRATLAFASAVNDAVSRCDILLDLSGGQPLFPAADLRDGYLRADPGDPAAMLRAVLKARDLVGSFDKPRYIAFRPDLCAHSRSRIVGCRRCLDLCPTGAIAPAGDHVAISAEICAGCGQCAAACPTGAASYDLPPADALMRKLRTLLGVYREAGGHAPIVLLHDEEHGGALIEALARHGDGLPANVLPLTVNEVTQVGLEAVAAAFAYGAVALRIVLRAKPRHDLTGLFNTIAMGEALLAGLGFGTGRLATLETDDPDALGAALRAIDAEPGAQRPATFAPAGAKRDVLRQALRELHHAAPAPVDSVALPAGAPFGAVEIDVAGCTLCLSCVSACPTGALADNPERPMLRFIEDSCVQCGLCKATCPEQVITLVPRLDFRAASAAPRTLKEEEPFACIRCGKAFGTKSTIERITRDLQSRHWMFQHSPQRLEVLKMCENCRVAAVVEENFDPRAAPSPLPRTTDDYLRQRDEAARGGHTKS